MTDWPLMLLMMPASIGWMKGVVFSGKNSTRMLERSVTSGWRGALSTMSRILRLWRQNSRFHWHRILSQRVPVIHAFFVDSYWTGRVVKSLGKPLRWALFPTTRSFFFSVLSILTVTSTVSLSLTFFALRASLLMLQGLIQPFHGRKDPSSCC